MNYRKKVKRTWQILAILTVIILLFFLWRTFNITSNISYLLFRHSTESLIVKCNTEWIFLDKLSDKRLSNYVNLIHSDSGLFIYELTFRRIGKNYPEKIYSRIISSKLLILEFDPNHFSFDVFYKRNNRFSPETAKGILDSNNLIFSVNANFFDYERQPMGWVVKNGQAVNRKNPSYKGYFFVKNNKPYFGPESLYFEINGQPSCVAQAYPAVMKNGEIFGYITNKANPFYNSYCANYRSLAGMKRNGNIIFILSNKAGIISFTEISKIAKQFDVLHATMFDAGMALQYAFRSGKYSENFAATNTVINIPIIGLKRMESPVFIGIKRNE